MKYFLRMCGLGSLLIVLCASNVVAAPMRPLSIVSTPTELQQYGVAEHYLVFDDAPRNTEILLQTKRVIQKTPNAFTTVDKLRIDYDGLIYVKGKGGKYYGLNSLGYAPGEKVDYRFVLSNGTVISEGFYVPRPIRAHSKNGSFSIEAQLVTVGPFTRYEIFLPGLDDQEEAHLASICEDELLNSDFTYRTNQAVNYMPGVIGKEGGDARVKITRQSGDSAVLRMLWGDAVLKPLLKEAKQGKPASEFRMYRSA